MLLGWIAIFHWGKALQGPLPLPTSANCRWSFIFSSNSHSVLYRLSVPPNALAAAMRALKTRWYSWSLCCFSLHPPKGCNFQHLYSFLNGICERFHATSPAGFLEIKIPKKNVKHLSLHLSPAEREADERRPWLSDLTISNVHSGPFFWLLLFFNKVAPFFSSFVVGLKPFGPVMFRPLSLGHRHFF